MTTNEQNEHQPPAPHHPRGSRRARAVTPSPAVALTPSRPSARRSLSRLSAAAVAMLVLAGCSASEIDGEASPTGAVTGSTTAEPTTSQAPATSDTPTEPTTVTVTEPAPDDATTEPEPTDEPAADEAFVGVYYVVDTRAGLRLARELHDVSAGDDAAAAAVEAMIAGADDPDYTTTWDPATEVLGVQSADDVITVDVSAAARTANVGSPGAAIMIQQLVWTVTDALDAPEAAVQLTIEGEPAGELWGAVDWSEPFGREEATAVRQLVQIDSPRDGEEVGSPVTVSGDAAAFEATVRWRVVDGDGDEVQSGFTLTAEGMTFSPYSFEVLLAPGDYTVEVTEDDPSDGEAGTPMSDTREFTVTG